MVNSIRLGMPGIGGTRIFVPSIHAQTQGAHGCARQDPDQQRSNSGCYEPAPVHGHTGSYDNQGQYDLSSTITQVQGQASVGDCPNGGVVFLPPSLLSLDVEGFFER